MASGSATTCRSRSRSIWSGRRRRSWSRSSSSACSCARRRARATYPRLDLLAHPLGRWLARPAVDPRAAALRARRLHHHHHRRLPRRPESLPQHRAHHGVDHLVGGLRLCFGLRRKSVGADQSLADDLRSGRDDLSRDHRAARRCRCACPIRRRSASGRRSCCCSRSSWIELVYPNPAVPRLIAWLAVGYSVLTFAGMFVFGRECWLRARRGVHLGVRHLRALCAARAARRAAMRLRRCGRSAPGCIDSSSVSTSMMAFVLLLLASVLYDGALGTPEWGKLESALAAHLAGARRRQAHGDPHRRPASPSGSSSSAPISGVSALMSAVTAGRLSPLAMARQLRLHAGPDRDRLSPRALPHVPADPGPVHHPARVGPVRLRLEPVRHRGLPGRHRASSARASPGTRR